VHGEASSTLPCPAGGAHGDSLRHACFNTHGFEASVVSSSVFRLRSLSFEGCSQMHARFSVAAGAEDCF
jgi:hypothetical protein